MCVSLSSPYHVCMSPLCLMVICLVLIDEWAKRIDYSVSVSFFIVLRCKYFVYKLSHRVHFTGGRAEQSINLHNNGKRDRAQSSVLPFK